jgi:formylglycine-generating enzyme required for sulfatase activity
LRDWLTRKQRETRRGRAELRLAERAAQWRGKRENRHLPAWWEWANIRLLTKKQDWTPPQRQMMAKAGRYHVLRGTLLAAGLILLSVAGWDGLGRLKAHALRDLLLRATTKEIPDIVQQMPPYRPWLDRLLREAAGEAGPEDAAKQLHLSLALLPVEPGQADKLYERLLTADPEEVRVIGQALQAQQDTLAPRLRTLLADAQAAAGHRLRAACVLAQWDATGTEAPDNPWTAAASVIVQQLLKTVQKNPSHYPPLLDLLRPVRLRLLAALAAVYRDRQRPESERTFATSILADYAADQPALLADVLVDGDAEQFAVLFPKVKEIGDPARTVLDAELDKTLQAEWQDAPLPPAWEKPLDPGVLGKIKAADGLVHERFAFCQTLPLAEFQAVADGLRAAGYRPSRYRPYALGQTIQVAAIWTRDGLNWRAAQGLSAAELRQQNADWQKQGFQPVDVAAYLSDTAERYAGLWVKAAATGSPTQLVVGLTQEQLDARTEELGNQGYQQTMLAALAGADGTNLYTALWNKPTTPPAAGAGSTLSFTGIEPDYSGENHLGDLQIDVQLSKSGPVPPTQDRFTKQLKDAQKGLKAKADDANLRFQRGLAHLYLGQLDKAVEDLSWFVDKQPKNAVGYRYRALARARQGKTKETKADLAKYQELRPEPESLAYLDAVVAAYLGEDIAGLKRLEAALGRPGRKAEMLYQGARAYAVASQAIAAKDKARSQAHADRARALLQELVAHGQADYAAVQTEADLDPIRQDPKFMALLAAVHVERQYVALWQPSGRWQSTEVHGLEPGEHQARCKELLGQGYRPVSFAVMRMAAGQALVTASVWQRPLVADADKERLAKRQAEAAVALLRLGRADKVWPLLQHRPDPRLRSYLIHRLRLLGADPQVLVRQLEAPAEVSQRRALLLTLGEFTLEQVAPAGGNELLAKIVAIHSSDPDAGLHGAAEWLLRQWHQEQRLQEIKQDWVSNPNQRAGRQEAIQRELTKPGAPAGPRWYINGQGQTMVVLAGPVEFVMGSPASEAGRNPAETWHRQRIGRPFALSATSVTIGEFMRSTVKERDYLQRDAPTTDCPMHAPTWYTAAEYCNWLSKVEGLLESEWCYLPNDDSKYAEGMTVAADYLQRQGYRLPTEAEWEYACRAGAVTSRYYGQTDELLEHYAWYQRNSDGRSYPVASKKPNDWGLFDMHGNVWTWCQNPFRDYVTNKGGKYNEDNEYMSIIIDTKSRSLRGGAFGYQPVSVRSAKRYGNVPPYRITHVGFRPARTLPLASFTPLPPGEGGSAP